MNSDEEEEHREHRGRHDHHHREGGRAVLAPEDPERHQGVLDPRLDQQEDGEQRDTEDQADHGAGGVPPVFLLSGPRETEHDRQQGARAGDRTGDVEPAGVALGLVEEAGGEERRRQTDRNDDEERVAPALEAQDRVEAGEPAAEDEADGGTHTRHGGVDRERAVALLAGGERGGDQGERGGRGHRGAEALEGPGRQQHGLVLGEAADERGECEDQHAHHEDQPAAVEVGQPATQEQEPPEGQGVAGDDPLQVGLVDVEVGADEGEGDVGDGAVEHHHQLRERDEHERPAQALVLLGGHLVGNHGAVGHGTSFWIVVQVESSRGVRQRVPDVAVSQGCQVSGQCVRVSGQVRRVRVRAARRGG